MYVTQTVLWAPCPRAEKTETRRNLGAPSSGHIFNAPLTSKCFGPHCLSRTETFHCPNLEAEEVSSLSLKYSKIK